MGKLRELLVHPLQKKFLIFLIIANFLGSIYGYYWYREQLATTPARYLLFVPDSPLSTTLFMFMLILISVTRTRKYFRLNLFTWEKAGPIGRIKKGRG